MKVRLIVDGLLGPNPEHKPPDPKVDLVGWMTYKHRVPPEIPRPKGTEIDHPFAWALCMPTEAGVVRAEPIDDDAKLMVQGEYQGWAPKVKRQYDHWQAQREAQLRAEAANQPEIIVADETPEEPHV